jgi:hypothetical protein
MVLYSKRIAPQPVGPLEQYRYTLSIGGLEEGHFIYEREVKRLLCDVVFLDDMGLVIVSLSFERHRYAPAVSFRLQVIIL